MTTADSAEPVCVVLMGVSGSGKTLLGEALAARLGLRFIEGDSLHPPANIAKMSGGVPLTDEDRWPWLDRIGETIREAARDGTGLIVTCSALKRSYRDRLRAASKNVAFIHLSGSATLLAERLAARRGHFMPPGLLSSQLATLEVPRDEPRTIAIDIAASPERIAGIAERFLVDLQQADQQGSAPER